MNQPAITALGVMAFLSGGHRPGRGPYGQNLTKAIDYILSTQQPSGMFSAINAEPFQKSIAWQHVRAHALYNHGIGALALSECYGEASPSQNDRIQKAIQKALDISRKYQTSYKRNKERDYGGWRYMMYNFHEDSDLSVTSWHLMFFRSAKGAGFDVPEEYADDAMAFVRRCYDPNRGQFRYCLFQPDARYTRAMSGAGIFSLAMGGDHKSEMAQKAGDWLLEVTPSFRKFKGKAGNSNEQYYYSVYYSTLGMFQLGGKYWSEFYPPVITTVLKNQNTDGSWERKQPGLPPSPVIGRVYTTSLMTMVLTISDQLLPICQR